MSRSKSMIECVTEDGQRCWIAVEDVIVIRERKPKAGDSRGSPEIPVLQIMLPNNIIQNVRDETPDTMLDKMRAAGFSANIIGQDNGRVGGA